jgi:putative membrane protein
MPRQSELLNSASLTWAGIFFTVLIWSAIEPKDYFIWMLEVLPAVIALGILAATCKAFPLTPLVYLLILLHCIILMVGGHYTYAEVPLFDWLKEPMGWTRNHYDKVGHFAQGFVPALIAREILLRRSPLQPGKWLFFIVACICLAISAFYEFVEWWVAVATGTAAEAFLATQGYVWDTQSDMLYALIGAIVAQLLLGRLHDRQLAAFNLD